MDAIFIAYLTFFTLIASIIWLSPKFRNFLTGEASLPPGPCGLPILGYLPFLRSNLHKQLTELAQKYGPIFKLWLGSKLCIVISSTSLIKEVVRDQDMTFANRDPPIAAMVATDGADIVWSPYGPYWRAMRKLFVREMLSNKNLDGSYSFRKQEIKKLVNNVYVNIGKKLDVGELIFETERNVTLNLLWGGMDKEKSDEIGGIFREVMSKLLDLLGQPNVSDFLPRLAKFDIQGIEKEMKNVLPSFHKIFDFVIKDRMKLMESCRSEGENMIKERRKDFLQVLLELKEQEDPEIPVEITQIKAIFLDIIAGGTDTTATTIEWAMAELLQNPHVMERVQQELAEVVGMSNTAEESHISKLHYLEAVLKETLRLHPPVPLLVPRCPSKSSTIGGYTIPKGSRVILNMWSIHMDPYVWKNPSEFIPERFLDDPGKFEYIGNNFDYLPFGSGRRVCPGILLAERMVMHLLATLLHSFDWKIPEGEKIDLSEKFGLVMRKRTPLFAVPCQRLIDANLYD